MATEDRIVSISQGRRGETQFTRRKRAAGERAAQRRLQDFVREVTGNILAAPPDAVDHGIQQGLRALGHFAQVSHSWLAIVGDDEGEKPRFREWHDPDLPPLRELLRNVEADAAPWFTDQFIRLSEVVLRHRSELPPDAHKERALMESLGVYAVAAVPSTAGGSLIVVGLAAHQPRLWEEDVMAALALLGSAVANILERRRNDRRLLNALAERQAIFHAVPDLFFRLKTDGTILDYDAARIPDLYLPPKCLFGKRIQTVLPAAVGQQYETALTTLARDHQAINIEYTLNVAGDQQIFEARLAPFLDAQAIALIRNVTATRRAQVQLEEAEHKFRGIFEHALDGIFQTSPDGRYISANPALARIYGYDSPHDLIASLTDIAGQLYVDPTRRLEFTRRLLQCDTVSGFESEVFRRDGRVIWISENARAVRDVRGQLLYYEGTVEDISERKHTEAALEGSRHRLEELVAELEDANRLKSEFVATMSHELCTPLNVILGYADLLLSRTFGHLSPDQITVLRRVDEQAKQLLDLINSTLDVGRLDAGRLPVEISDVNLEALLQELQSEIGHRCERAGLEVCWHIDPLLPTLRSDAFKLKMVFKNLVSNAIKFTPNGSVSIAVSNLDNGIRFRVSDTGVGIAPEALPIIFEAFRQGDGSPTREFGGVGLGLYIVQRLLDILGGRIEVQSALGEGSVFTVWLPVAVTSRPSS